jgi:hypothetical protein
MSALYDTLAQRGVKAEVLAAIAAQRDAYRGAPPSR